MTDYKSTLEKLTRILRTSEDDVAHAREALAKAEAHRISVDEERRNLARTARKEGLSINAIRIAIGFPSHSKTVNYLEGKALRNTGPRAPKPDDDLYF